MKKQFKLFYLLIIVFFVFLTNTNTYASATNIKAKRLAGNSRVGTSIEIAKESYKTASNVILVGYKGEVDALTGALLAKSKNAPIIFVNKNEVNKVKTLLRQLQTKKVYILGGDKVFSEDLALDFKEYDPKRLAGNNRFQTAVNLSKEVVGNTRDEIFLSLGVDDYADALAIGPISAKRNIPLLLTKKTSLPPETLMAIKAMKVKKVNIIGGRGAVSQTIEDQLKALNISTTRTSGDSRELTAINIAKKWSPTINNIVMANGWNFTDAVAGGYFTAKKDGVLLLTNTNKIKEDTLNFIKDKKTPVFILGGEKVISSKPVNDIELYLNTSQASNERELINLINNKNIRLIEITNNISLSSPLKIQRPLTLEGNDKTISGTKIGGIEIYADHVKINNLSVANSAFDNILFRNVLGGELNNVSLKNAGEEGLFIDSSKVRVNNLHTLDNAFGGIRVFHNKTQGKQTPQLTVIGSHKHSSKNKTPAIRISNSKTNPNWVLAKGYEEEAFSAGGEFWEYLFFIK